LSTIDRPDRLSLPPLAPGPRLDRATFHERYKAMPPHVRAELVGGVVYMASPLSPSHGRPDQLIAFWIGYYQTYTPWTDGASNATTIFDDFGEHQPDQSLWISEERGGRARIVDGFIEGPPELIVEIGVSSRAFDLGPKKADYERAGVLEYLFIGVDPEEVRWFTLRDGPYQELPLDADGLIRSDVFPGLWLDPAALFARDRRALLAALDRGLATPEHAAFVANLSGRP
jgi:Uma2 family endonuclease